MITEEYVSFETAKLLKEKGFDAKCFDFYEVEYEEAKHKHTQRSLPVDWNGEEDENCYSCPTQQMAMRWLREEKHYYIQIMLDGWALGSHSGYYIVIQATDSDFKELNPVDKVFFETHEQATEAAIKYCLTNLI